MRSALGQIALMIFQPVVCKLVGHRWHRWSWHATYRDSLLCDRCGACAKPSEARQTSRGR